MKKQNGGYEPQRDLRGAEIFQRDEMYEGAAFHAQQAAVKALKSLLIQLGQQERTHSCVRLLQRIHHLASSFLNFPDDLMTDARMLDIHYISSRYPNGVGGPPEEFYYERVSSDLLNRARRIYNSVQSALTVITSSGDEKGEGMKE